MWLPNTFSFAPSTGPGSVPSNVVPGTNIWAMQGDQQVAAGTAVADPTEMQASAMLHMQQCQAMENEQYWQQLSAAAGGVGQFTASQQMLGIGGSLGGLSGPAGMALPQFLPHQAQAQVPQQQQWVAPGQAPMTPEYLQLLLQYESNNGQALYGHQMAVPSFPSEKEAAPVNPTAVRSSPHQASSGSSRVVDDLKNSKIPQVSKLRAGNHLSNKQDNVNGISSWQNDSQIVQRKVNGRGKLLAQKLGNSAASPSSKQSIAARRKVFASIIARGSIILGRSIPAPVQAKYGNILKSAIASAKSSTQKIARRDSRQSISWNQFQRIHKGLDSIDIKDLWLQYGFNTKKRMRIASEDDAATSIASDFVKGRGLKKQKSQVHKSAMSKRHQDTMNESEGTDDATDSYSSSEENIASDREMNDSDLTFTDGPLLGSSCLLVGPPHGTLIRLSEEEETFSNSIKTEFEPFAPKYVSLLVDVWMTVRAFEALHGSGSPFSLQDTVEAVSSRTTTQLLQSIFLCLVSLLPSVTLETAGTSADLITVLSWPAVLRQVLDHAYQQDINKRTPKDALRENANLKESHSILGRSRASATDEDVLSLLAAEQRLALMNFLICEAQSPGALGRAPTAFNPPSIVVSRPKRKAAKDFLAGLDNISEDIKHAQKIQKLKKTGKMDENGNIRIGRGIPDGFDRHNNRYYIVSCQPDTILCESAHGEWWLQYSAPWELRLLLRYLHPYGKQEGRLRKAVISKRSAIEKAMASGLHKLRPPPQDIGECCELDADEHDGADNEPDVGFVAEQLVAMGSFDAVSNNYRPLKQLAGYSIVRGNEADTGAVETHGQKAPRMSMETEMEEMGMGGSKQHSLWLSSFLRRSCLSDTLLAYQHNRHRMESTPRRKVDGRVADAKPSINIPTLVNELRDIDCYKLVASTLQMHGAQVPEAMAAQAGLCIDRFVCLKAHTIFLFRRLRSFVPGCDPGTKFEAIVAEANSLSSIKQQVTLWHAKVQQCFSETLTKVKLMKGPRMANGRQGDASASAVSSVDQANGKGEGEEHGKGRESSKNNSDNTKSLPLPGMLIDGPSTAHRGGKRKGMLSRALENLGTEKNALWGSEVRETEWLENVNNANSPSTVGLCVYQLAHAGIGRVTAVSAANQDAC